MKKKIIAILCCTALLASSFMFVGCKKKQEEQPQVATSYVTMDINPSVELVVDQNNKVMSVYAANEDAEVMLYGEEGIIGVDVQAASQKILDLSVEYGYLTEDNSGVSVSVVSDKQEAEENIKRKINASIETKSASVAFDISFTYDDSFSIKRKLEEYKEKYPELTGAKLKLILQAQACDNTLSFDDAYNMTTEQLLNIVETKKTALQEFCNEQYQKAVASAQVVYGQTVDVAMATALAAKAASYVSLSNASTLSKQLVKYPLYVTCGYALQNVIVAVDYIQSYEMPSAVIDAIATKLGLTEDEKVKMKNDEGKYTVESIENYIDKIAKNAAGDAKAEIEAKYAELITILTTAENQAKEENEVIKGEVYNKVTLALETVKDYLSELGITLPEKLTLDDLKEMQAKFEVGAENARTAIYDNISEKQQEELDAYMVECQAKYSEAEQTMQNAIAEAKKTIEAELASKKAELKAKE